MVTASQRVDAALSAIRSHGKRVTTPKRLVAEYLARQRSHRTADEIRAGVQRREPSVSTSTVYRILEEFGELGVVLHSHAGGNAAVYHLADVEHVMAHEMVHMVLFKRGHSKWYAHGPSFKAFSKRVCSAFGFNLETF